jgi:hypothetical protein
MAASQVAFRLYKIDKAQRFPYSTFDVGVFATWAFDVRRSIVFKSRL